LLALEINELENYKKNAKVFSTIGEIRKENLQKFEEFKVELRKYVKKNIIMNPYLWASIGGGMVVMRSLIFGSSLGGISYILGRNISNRLVKKRDTAITNK
jgi:hypothetical protein